MKEMRQSRPQPRTAGLSRRAYARARGVDESTVREHIASGLLKPALLPDGSIDAAAADALLAKGRTRGRGTTTDLAGARRRKLAAQVALLADEVAERDGNLVPVAEAKRVAAEILRRLAWGLRPLVAQAPALAGRDSATAFALLTESVHEILTGLSETPVVAEQGCEPDTLSPALEGLDPVALAARKADLEAQRIELIRAEARGELVALGTFESMVLPPCLTYRAGLLALPTKLAPSFEGLDPTGAAAALREALQEILANVANDDVTFPELIQGIDP
jgi:hypothetical protein